LGHGADYLTSPPKEGMLRIFIYRKIQRLRPGLNPRTREPACEPLGHRSRPAVAKDSAVILSDQPFKTAHIKVAINLVPEF
jgi:hypothetical protein